MFNMMKQMVPSIFYMRKVAHYFLTPFNGSSEVISDHHTDKQVDHILLKIQYLKQLASFDNTSEHLRNSCVAIFNTAVSDPLWIQVECSHTFEHNVLFFEYPATPLNVKQTYLYKRKYIFCQAKVVYINGSCWHISRYGSFTKVDVYTDSTMVSISSMLTSWSLANVSRYSIRINNPYGHNCLKRIGFKYQRLVNWKYTDNCTNINSTLHYLISKLVSYYSHVCKSSSHFKCKDNTCILSAYVCDGYADCSGDSDEVNCTKVCTQGTDSCHHACVSTACVSTACVSTSCVCSDMYYHCLSHECILLTFLCDNWQHCKDSSDESTCPSQHTIDMQAMTDFIVKVINLCRVDDMYS